MNQKGPKCPTSVTPEMVSGLVDILSQLEAKVDVAAIASEVGMEAGKLLETLEACEALGLVSIEDGDAVLTQTGTSFSRKRQQGRIRMLRELVKSVEPFKSILQYISSVTRPVTAEEICRDLGLCDYNDPEGVSQLKSFILHWLVTTGYLSYDGRDEQFRVRGRHRS